MSEKRILGINSAYHESAACLVVDGEIVAMAEEERFNRIRHGKHALIDNSDELPESAMAWCLSQAGIDWADLDAIGYSLDPELRYETQKGRVETSLEGWGTEAGERCFYEHNLAARDKLAARAPRAEFHFLPHHLCHAASAYLVSPFERAAVLVVDGIGEKGSSWMGLGSGSELDELETVDYPHSLGFVWERISEFLGFDVYSGPGKVMGYAAITDPEGELTGHDHLSSMRQILYPVPDGTFFVDDSAFRFRTDDFSGLERFFGPRRDDIVDRYEDASVAAALQEATNDILVHMACRLHAQCKERCAEPVDDLCLAGGVALNCVANYEVAARSPFKRIWVQPAANDAGTALGAAVLLHFRLGGRERPRMRHAYLGPGYSADQMRSALEAEGLDFGEVENLPAEVARRIERGQIVAWFQGRQEVGPRALGHRSIVCDPSRFDTRTRINMRVKYRESFRPFAPSCLPEAVERFFVRPAEMLSTRYMLFALPLVERKLMQVIPAVIQENGSTGLATSRIHEVEEEHCPHYAQLIREFKRLTDLPIVLNTSFNIREPIVTSPQEAIRTFLSSSMDALAMGPFLAPHPKVKSS
ncbi:MAG: carbamoyl transferase [Deltaproteobacteria bacterium]|nr:carbamoyl transferase [Deltaproteobacteria bacterium]